MEKVYSEKPDIFAFLDYRNYLREIFEFYQSQKGHSHRSFSKLCGFTSPNYPQLLIQGKRKLSVEAARKICKALALDEGQKSFFLYLVDANQAASNEERVQKIDWLMKQPRFLKANRLTERQFNYFRNWYNVAVREMILVMPQADAKILARYLVPAVSVTQVQESLDLLEDLGLIVATASGWSSADRVVRSGDLITSSALVSFHHQMLELAKESIERFRGDVREVSSVTVNLSPTQFEEFQLAIRKLKTEILAASEDTTSAEQIYQFNFQLFPLTEKLS